MSGPIGVVSTKLALVAGALLVSARVDLHSVAATIDPSQPVTAISADLAARAGIKDDGPAVRPLAKRLTVGMDHAELRLEKVVVRGDTPNRITLGADLLQQMTLALDFRKGRLRVIERGALRRATADMIPIAARSTPDGCLSISGRTPDGSAAHAALVGRASDDGPRASVAVAGVELQGTAQPAQVQTCPSNQMLLDWRAFAGSAIILDLGNDRIWVPRKSQ